MANDSSSIQSSRRFRVPGITTKNLSVVVTGLVAIIAILKADKRDIPKIVDTIFGSHVFAVVGWTLAIVILLVSVVSIKLLIQRDDKEINRLTDERDYLQKRLLK
jgi:ATP/ADP translocase